MNFLKKIFVGQNDHETKPDIPNEPLIKELPKTKRTIPDFFQLNFKDIPDESYIAGDIELNTEGKKVQTFRKTLDYKECGIFDTIEVHVIDEIHKNATFISFQADKVRIEDLKNLVDSIYMICGSDVDLKGKFTKTDVDDYFDTKYAGWLMGRWWNEKGIMMGRSDDELTMTIHGIDKL